MTHEVDRLLEDFIALNAQPTPEPTPVILIVGGSDPIRSLLAQRLFDVSMECIRADMRALTVFSHSRRMGKQNAFDALMEGFGRPMPVVEVEDFGWEVEGMPPFRQPYAFKPPFWSADHRCKRGRRR